MLYDQTGLSRLTKFKVTTNIVLLMIGDLLIVNVWLMLSVALCPKVIKLNAFTVNQLCVLKQKFAKTALVL
jgi:hypothetical protein